MRSFPLKGISLLLFVISIAKPALLRAQAVNFVTAWEFEDQNTSDSRGIAVDVDKNIVVVGEFQGTIDLDPGAGTYNCAAVGGGLTRNVFVAKTSPTGQFIWGGSLPGRSSVLDVLTDGEGNIFFAGYFVSDSLDLDPGSGVHWVQNLGGGDGYVVKLDSAGNFLLAYTFPSVFAGISEMILDPSGDLILAGNTQGTVDMDPGAGVYTLNHVGGLDIFMCRLNPSGGLVWAKSLSSAGNESATRVNQDNIGNIYVIGYFEDSLDFDPGSGTTYRISAGDLDGFIAKYSPSGDLLWTGSFGGIGRDVTTSVVVDEHNNVFLGGYYSHKADFDPGPDTLFYTSVGPGATDDDCWVAKLDVSGNLCWAQRYGGFFSDMLRRIEYVPGGYLYLAGTMQLTVDFDFNPAVINNRVSKGAEDVYLFRIDTAGVSQWALSAGGSLIDETKDMATDRNGEIFVAGNFRGTADVDPGAGVFNLTSGISTSNAFVWHISDCVPHFMEDKVLSCSAYVWIDGITYSSDTYGPWVTLQNSKGCDSTVTLNLNIRQPSSATHTIAVCDSFEWVKGRVFYMDTTGVLDTIPNAVGCDSVVTLNLNILNTHSMVQNVQACDSFIWVNGQTYYSSVVGTEFKLYTNAEGCDSVVWLDLTLSNSLYRKEQVSYCKAFTWIDGKTYTRDTAMVFYRFGNTSGCDSILELQFDITPMNLQITQNSYLLSVAQSGTYQWYTCNGGNYIPIQGAGQSSYTVTANGQYSVSVTDGNCSDTSACITVTNIGWKDNWPAGAIEVYPNPTGAELHVRSNVELGAGKLRVFDMLGKEVQTMDYPGNKEFGFELEGVQALYWLVLETESGVYRVLVNKK